MYKREIQRPRESPIEKRIPLAGTWTGAFGHVDLLEVHRPFALPVPKWMKDLRIKEWQSFIIQDDAFYLEAALINVKYYRMAEVFLYDKGTKEKLLFRKIIPFGGWKLPRDLHNASITSRSYGFYFRIHDWLDADTVKVDLDIEPTIKRPSFTAHIEFDLDRTRISPMAVNLLFSERRNMYAFKAFSPVRGDMVYGGRHVSFDPLKTSGLFGDFKGFYPYRMNCVWCTGFGFDPDERRFGFSSAASQTKEQFSNNENALWVDGELSPLPPVRITMLMGIESDWVIQDLEGMVDLTFTPLEHIHASSKLIITRSEHDTPLGYFNGMLLNSKGEQIQVRNLWGLGEKLYLRI